MKHISILFILSFILHLTTPFFVYAADEIKLTEDEKLTQILEWKVIDYLPTVKRFLAERGQCSDILENTTVKSWYTEIVEVQSRPIEERRATYDLQANEIKTTIWELEAIVDEKTEILNEKKDSFFDGFTILSDSEVLIEEIKNLEKEILLLKWQITSKKQELQNITDVFISFPTLTREQITSIFHAGLNQLCSEWYGQVELTDKKTLELRASSLEDSIGTKKVISKYQKLLDKVSLIYIDNPEAIEKLNQRLGKVLPKISKDHKYYEFLVELRRHMNTLVK